jgi:hypothetical protein
MYSNRNSGGRECSHLAAGDAAEFWERPDRRLTLTVGEAAESLGISGAFGYEAVARGAMPCIHISRRVPGRRVALEEILGAAAGHSSDGGS